jgi:predicted RNase H-like HicB family nuclease
MPIVIKPVHLKLTAIIELSDNAFVAICPELDLATEGDTPEAALSDLIDMALDYSEQYMAELDRFTRSPNRAVHAPYIQVLRSNPTPAGVRALFED